MVGADADADEQVEVARGDPVAGRGADDLLKLLERVEAEGPHAISEIGLGDGFLRLHRVHEALHRLGQGLVDQAHFGDRGDVIMGDSAVPQDPEQVGRRVGLDRIERAARKLLDEESGGATRSVRTKKRNRLDRSAHGDSGTPPDAGWGGG